jgi:hypothetical protein
MSEMTVLELTEADIAHRREFMQYCINAAEEHHRRILRVLYSAFEDWNRNLFGSQLEPPHFLILEPRMPTAEGDYSSIGGWGSKSQIRIRPALIDATWPDLINGSGDPEGVRRYWLDVALHELVHAFCNEILGRPEAAEKGHGRVFTRECNRVGQLLGLPPVGQARKSRNREGLPSCAFWPSNVRPEGYYLGAYRPDLRPRRPTRQTRWETPPVPAPPQLVSGLDLEALLAADLEQFQDMQDMLDREQGSRSDLEELDNPLDPNEWQQLVDATARLPIAPLIERLVEHYGVAVDWPAPTPQPAPAPQPVRPVQPQAGRAPTPTPSTAPSPSATPAATSAAVSPLPAPAALEHPEDAAILLRLSPGFEPSHYQMGLFRFVVSGQGDGLVNAVAGSGKSTSLVEAARLIDQSALFLAFNKHISEELSQKLRGTSTVAKTIHAIGHGCLMRHLSGRIKIDDRKYQKIARAAAVQLVRAPGEAQQKVVTVLNELTRFVRLTLTDPTDRPALREMIEHYGIELDEALEPAILPLLPELLKEGEKQARDTIIDYTDQLYLPWRWQLQPPQLAWVFVDECQDLSAAQLDLALKCRKPGGRMVFVGDPAQSVQGFAGADNDSFWNIQKRTGAQLLPLSVCYRCPSSHIDLARAIVPQIEARPGAPVGVIEHIKEDRLADQVQAGDMVICRLTAPLIKTCIDLIHRRIPARVRGRNLGDQLTSIVRTVAETPGFRYEEFAVHLARYHQQQLAKLQAREAEAQIQALNDRVEAVQAVYESSQATSAAALASEIEALFSDEAAAVTLSTIHRAKGLEAERVFLLHPDKVPLVWEKQQAWELEQEHNLRYVALTRAKDMLVFVEPKAKPKKRRGLFDHED